MTQTTLIRKRGKLYAYSFTTGVKPVEPKFKLNDETIMLACLHLENAGKLEEAHNLLDKYYPTR